MWTRVTDEGFEQGDQTGLYVVNFKDNASQALQNSGNHVNNMCFTYDGGWSAASNIYWTDAVTHADFYCYYPYSSNIVDVTKHSFKVSNNQSDVNNYKSSDFMWAKRADVAPTSDAVQINVRHAMSNIIVKLVAGKGFKDEDLANAKVVISGLKTSADINLTTGMATATGSAEDIIPMKENGYYRALVVPQNVKNVALVKVDVNGTVYKLNQSVTFEANKKHTCTVTLKKTEGGLDVGVDGWDDDGVDHGGDAE